MCKSILVQLARKICFITSFFHLSVKADVCMDLYVHVLNVKLTYLGATQ